MKRANVVFCQTLFTDEKVEFRSEGSFSCLCDPALRRLGKATVFSPEPPLHPVFIVYPALPEPGRDTAVMNSRIPAPSPPPAFLLLLENFQEKFPVSRTA